MNRGVEVDFDWDSFWEDPTDIDEMEEGARRMAQRLCIFMDSRPVTTVADYGCGPALTLFRLAMERPDVRFYGFDVSGEILGRNRKLAEREGLDNLMFEMDTLPRPSTVEVFDLVFCIATLHYVEEIEEAVRNLFERVSPGGHLVFNYPNIHTMYAYQRWVRRGGVDRRRRFHLVLNGRNLLTLRDISRILCARPRNVWRAVGEDSSRENVCVYVRRDPESYGPKGR